MLHSKQAVMRGRMTRTCPLKPSVPPSMKGMMVLASMSTSPSGVVLTKEQSSEFNQRRATRLSRQPMTRSKPRKKSSGRSWM